MTINTITTLKLKEKLKEIRKSKRTSVSSLDPDDEGLKSKKLGRTSATASPKTDKSVEVDVQVVENETTSILKKQLELGESMTHGELKEWMMFGSTFCS